MCLLCWLPSFPRIRGDVPNPEPKKLVWPKFSPHTRGCSLYLGRAGWGDGVFPAYAGMFLRAYSPQLGVLGFPRIRGDVPSQKPN